MNKSNIGVTEEEANLLKYFWEAKGDLTRWVGWDDFCKKNPYAVEVWERYVELQTEADTMVKDYITLCEDVARHSNE